MKTCNKVYPFVNQSVRDLAWVIESAPIIENIGSNENIFFTGNYCEKEFNKFNEEILKLNLNPEPLEEFLLSKKSRLIGKRFETLVEYWLRQNEGIRLIASNLQVNKKGRTLGEFDFIYFDKLTGEYIHLEVAGKFFLWSGKDLSFQNFIGPNKSDNLQLKLNQILSKQIKLSFSAEGKSVLKKLGIEEIKQKICFKGYIFYPFPHNKLKIFPSRHSMGYWVYFNEIEQLNGENWLILERDKWISPFFGSINSLSLEKLKVKLNQYFSMNSYPLLIINLKQENSIYYEAERYFVVPEKFFNN